MVNVAVGMPSLFEWLIIAVAGLLLLSRRLPPPASGPTMMPERLPDSFRVRRPACPRCHEAVTRLDRGADNLWRVPLATVSAALLYPVVGLRFRCPRCGCRFVASRDGTTAGGGAARGG